MENTKDKQIMPALAEVINQLPKEEQNRLAWIAQGILIGSEGRRNGRD